MLNQIIVEENIDVAILSEQYFQKGNKGCIIDIMFANESLRKHIKWTVANICTKRDHAAIIPHISYSQKPELLSRNTSRRWSWKHYKFDTVLFKLVWSAPKVLGDDAALMISAVRKELLTAYNATKRRTSGN